MAKIITCQVQVLDGSNINIDVNVSLRGLEAEGGERAPHPSGRLCIAAACYMYMYM